ncbi:MAG: lysophospholipid acyltransferase family protein [Methylophilaceae bacterium]|nr:lysophospholipid acyltransferase family protein [Methylophilaceae bacterium]
MAPFKLKLLHSLLKSLGRLPLPVVHALGLMLGWLVYLLSSKHARLTRENLRLSGTCADEPAFRRTLRRNIGESGKALLETFAIWFRSDKQQMLLVQGCQGWEHIVTALQRGKGIIFLTPHLGCFEITSLFYAALHPITVLYRPPRQDWMLPMIEAGRARGKVKLAPANAKGVRDLLQALRQGEAIGVLPDQVPAQGEGEWAAYFGRPAYTMTLVSRLAQKTGATVLIAFGERLPWGQGYIVHVDKVADGAIDTAAGLNAAIEKQVRTCPEQYLWSYPRHKARRGA